MFICLSVYITLIHIVYCVVRPWAYIPGRIARGRHNARVLVLSFAQRNLVGS